VKKSSRLLVVPLILLLAAALFFYLRDMQPPDIALTPAGGPLRSANGLQLQVQDPGAGLRWLRVTAQQGQQQFVLFDQRWSNAPASLDQPLQLDPMLQDGSLTLLVETGDAAPYPFGGGNQTQQLFSFELDNRPPQLTVLSRSHNLTQGGSGLLLFRASEPVSDCGLQIGERFFPAFQQPSGDYLCLFSYPHDAARDSVPRLVAKDRAGNTGNGGFYYHINRRTFAQDQIGISDGFLQQVMPQFRQQFPDAATDLDLFLRVNRELRPANRQRLIELCGNSSSQPLWQGPFLRQPNAATRATFGDVRSYLYQGQKIDQQTHMGIDLASTAQAEVPVANSGRVVFADYLGIYGNCVLVDHGLGLHSLYAHLTRMDVQPGQSVARGQIVGTTGATGLAGGDHLHYEMMIGGLPINPIEWWDASWMTNNIDSKLQQLAGQTGL
jgi:murein DD-endopeptidase MepM/ murein hydrolase activator NlpD